VNELNLNSRSAQYIQTSLNGGVLTVMMHQPKKLNGWTDAMMDDFKEAFIKASMHDSTKVVIFTGAGNYYSAGVNFAGIKPMPPRKLRAMIIDHNQQLFEAFLNFPKPILVAMNGPAIGASVTSATLCNGIVASQKATFSTPFAALGLPAEGCSSIHFPRLLGEQTAQRMLGKEGWKPNGSEALAVGLVQWTVPHENLLDEAHKIAQNWIAQGIGRTFLAGSTLEELLAVNARKSIEVADAILSAAFLREQARFLWSKDKHGPSIMFWSVSLLRPFWARFL
jgi:peroxisomal 3,2-trans-enoyl-CoA isomerase